MKIDTTALRDSRKESTDMRTRLIAGLKQEVVDSINNYIAVEPVPAGAEVLNICIKAFYIKDGVLYVNFTKEFTSTSVCGLAKYKSYDTISLGTVNDAVLLVPNSMFYTCALIDDELVKINDNSSEFALYYEDVIGVVTFREIWEEELPFNFSIPLT